MGEKPSDSGGRDRRATAAAQGTPGAPGAGRARKVLCWGPCREPGPADGSISGFWPPDCVSTRLCLSPWPGGIGYKRKRAHTAPTLEASSSDTLSWTRVKARR